MCELTSIAYSVFLLPKKDAARKKELLEQPKLIKGNNSQLPLNKSLKPRLSEINFVYDKLLQSILYCFCIGRMSLTDLSYGGTVS